jgi:peptidyl-prolyl cis-trans isomerase D
MLEHAQRILKDVFGYDSFRGRQGAIIERVAKGGKLAAPFDNPKLMAALFSDDGLKNKRNTEAVEVASGTLVSARVLEHKPGMKPSDDLEH